MKVLPRTVARLIQSFERLPGIGPKSAARLTFYLLHVPQKDLDEFSESVGNLKRHTIFCSVCCNIGEQDPCVVCAETSRDHTTICILEQPIDILTIEKTGKYHGVYHVLHGAINPLANIGPDEIRIAQLLQRVASGTIQELILATNPNMEGEATAMYIKREISNLKSQNAKLQDMKITRLARGLPVGGDLEYADEVTVSRALEGRNEY